jgi:CheY-like chemotaxis protein
MEKDMIILIAEDDMGHFELVKRHLWLNCAGNDFLHFKDGQEVLDFLFKGGNGVKHGEKDRYLLLLDIRMPGVDGLEVLRKIKENRELSKIPVIMLTTTDEPSKIERCYELGCSFFMVKPTDYNKFMEMMKDLGVILSLEWLKVPSIDRERIALAHADRRIVMTRSPSPAPPKTYPFVKKAKTIDAITL